MDLKRYIIEAWRKLLTKQNSFNLSIKSLKIACIFDEFTYLAYSFECNLYQLTFSNYFAELNEIQPDLLFIESAWLGKDNSWARKIASSNEELRNIVKWCNVRNIPTIFWNKEDPVHFNTFKDIAKIFDFVFTSDLDCIIKYKVYLKHDHVYFLPFACQPALHNPIELYERKDSVCFAGAYYERYPERQQNFDDIIEVLQKHVSVEIYDRNFYKVMPGYNFPAKYKPLIKGNLPATKIDKAYKGYKYAINMNSVKYSQGMMARRVYELLASNTLVISNYSVALKRFFGDLIISSDNVNSLNILITKLFADTELQRRIKLHALRNVLQNHTYNNRLSYIISKINASELRRTLPDVYVISVVKNYIELQNIVQQFKRQVYEYKQLIIVDAYNSDFICHHDENIKLIPECDFTSFCQSKFINSGYISILNPDNYYGSNYLLDLVLATRYIVDHDVVISKAKRFSMHNSEFKINITPEYVYNDTVNLSNSIIYHTHLKLISLDSVSNGLFSFKLKSFIIDGYSFCSNASYNLTNAMLSEINADIKINTGLSMQQINAQCEALTSHKNNQALALPRTEYLLVTNNYPNYNNLYRNAFIHTRIKEYVQHGLFVDVFAINSTNQLHFYEFEGINVINGNSGVLEKLLDNGFVKCVLVHFLSPQMWKVLKKHVDKIKIIIWAHGYEIQSWQRRLHNFTDAKSLTNAKKANKQMLSIWRDVIKTKRNIEFVFVSNYLAQTAFEDVGVVIDKSKYHIINNYINTELFSYKAKPIEQRKKILSIRPYANHNYANDLAVKTVLALSKTEIFSDLEFCFIGDGILFEETLAPLRQFSNVQIIRKFISQIEIALLHKEYGLFLVPSRMDTQGVSRDEAMSSGLVPLTNLVAAIPEFIDDSCAILANAESFQEFVDGIIKIYHNPKYFLELSANAGNLIKNARSYKFTIEKELNVLMNTFVEEFI